ncbi:hypothetical protein MFUM_800013 [Methylacidiphilum fumariolicum SolV]|uniref:Uncharacterized protein n=1 Tax=Methylacidiphilum fumariolicum (strain SolV) TaxID=1156937 RepID=I0JZY0_METFB|nr:hypothetical protein MFUM_800013 [Methylacidiphilum fumariolicum SolV]
MFVNQAKIASILPHYTLKILRIFPNHNFYVCIFPFTFFIISLYWMEG